MLYGSVDHGDRVDLDEAARISREPNHLHGCRRGLGVAEIFGPDPIECVLIGEIGDETIGRDHIAEIRADGLKTAAPRAPDLPCRAAWRRTLPAGADGDDRPAPR